MKLKFHKNPMVYDSLTMFNKDSILREVLILHSWCWSLIASMFCGLIQILGLQAIHIYILWIYSQFMVSSNPYIHMKFKRLLFKNIIISIPFQKLT
jgi:hypothetical protein